MYKLLKSYQESTIYDRGQYTFGLVNFITSLMEKDQIEKALELVNIYFEQLSITEKLILTENIIQATTQYDIPNELLPESYYDFVISQNSNQYFYD